MLQQALDFMFAFSITKKMSKHSIQCAHVHIDFQSIVWESDDKAMDSTATENQS